MPATKMRLLVQTDTLIADKELEAIDSSTFLRIPELVLQLIEQRNPENSVATSMVEALLPIVYPKYDGLLSYPLLALMMADFRWNEPKFKLENLYQLFDQTFGNQIPIFALSETQSLKARNFIDMILAEAPSRACSKIVRSWHGKVSFKYPLLAELFATKWLVQNLHLRPIAELLLTCIFVDRKYAVISALIDEAMSNKFPCEDTFRAFDTVLCENWDSSAHEFSQCKALNKLLFVLLEDRRFELFKFLLAILFKRPQMFTQILLLQDQTGMSVLGSCILRLPEDQKGFLAKFVTEKFSQERATEISRVNFVQALFFSQCYLQQFQLFYVDVKRLLFPMVSTSSHVFVTHCLEFLSGQPYRDLLWEQIGQTNDLGCNILHLAIESNTMAAVKSICTFLEFQNPQIMRDLLLEIDDSGENVLFKAVKSEELRMPEQVLSLLKAKSDISIDQIQDMLCARDKTGRNLLLAALTTGNSGLTRGLLTTLKSELPELALQNLLSQSTDAGENLIYVAVEHCDYATVMALQDFIQTELGGQVLDANLHQETKANTNLLYVTLTKSYQHQISRDLLFTKLLEQTSPSLFRPFLCAENEENFNLLHHAVKNSSARSLRLLFEFLDYELGFEVVVTFLLSDAANGATMLHIAAAFRKKTFLKYLVFFLIETVGHNNFRLMLQRKNAFGESILHVAAKHMDCDAFLYILEVLTVELGERFVDEMLVLRNYEDKTILQLAIEEAESSQFGACKKFLQFLFKLLEGRLGAVKLLNILSSMDNAGHYLIHVAVKMGSQQLFEFLSLKLEPSILEMMLSSSDVQNSNIGLLAIEHGDANLVACVFESCDARLIYRRRWDERSAVHLAVQAKDERNLDFVMKSWDQASLRQKDTNHRNILHLAAAHKQPSRVRKVLDCVDSGVDLSEMLHEKDKDGLNPLHVVVKCQRRLAICEIFDYLRKRMGKESFSKLLRSTTSARESILHLAAEHTNTLTLDMLIDRVAREVDADLLVTKNEKLQTLLLIAAKKGNPSMVTLLLRRYSNFMDKCQFQEMLTGQTRQGANLLLFAVQANNVALFKRFIDLLREANDIELVRTQLSVRTKLEFPLTILASAVYNCDWPSILEICQILEDIFGKAEFHRNFFDKGFFNYVIASGRILVIEKFFDICKSQNRLDMELKNLKCGFFDECSASAIDQFMQMAKAELGAEKFGNFLLNINFLFVSVRNGSKSKITVVLKMLSENLDEATLQKTLKIKEPESGFNVLLCAVHYQDTSVVDFLIAVLRRHLSQGDIEELMCQKGDDGSNILHNFIRPGSKLDVCDKFDLLFRYLSAERLSKMVLAMTKRRNNVVHVAMINCNPLTIDWLLEFLETVVTHEEINKLLMQKTQRGSHLFHHAVKANDHFIVAHVFDMLKRRFKLNTAKQMLHNSNKIDQNIVYICGLYGSTSTFKQLIGYLADTQKPADNVLRKLRAKDINKENILMCAARNPDVRMFEVVADYLFKMLPNEEVKEMMCASNKNGLTLLHIIAKDQLYFDGYFEYLLDKLGKIEFLQARNAKGYSAVEVACRREEDIALENYLEWFNRIDPDITKELVAEVLMKIKGIKRSKMDILQNYQ